MDMSYRRQNPPPKIQKTATQGKREEHANLAPIKSYLLSKINFQAYNSSETKVSVRYNETQERSENTGKQSAL